jgi:YD repeat-containing protein
LDPARNQPTLYAYADPIGRTYLITSGGQLQSIQDLNGNTLTVTSTGITSSVNGVVVPFVRDPNTGNITKITDLNGNAYVHSYDGSGNLLQSVQYPGMTPGCSQNNNCPETYTYFPDHSLQSETDPRGNTSSAVYCSSANDGGQTALDGRLYCTTDTMQNTWTYAYNLATNTTTTTNPDNGTLSRTDDSFGNPLSVTEQVNSTTSRTTTYQYDAKENLISITDADPLGNTSHKTYNSYGGELTSTDAANTNTQTTTYDANFNPRRWTC